MAAEHAQVRTLNRGYDRVRSHVLVRQITHATRATLDYAAYHANFMLTEAAPENAAAEAPSSSAPGKTSTATFKGLLDAQSFTPDIAKTALSAAERRQPLAFAPLSEFLLAARTPGAERFEALGAAVRAESWGQPATAGVASQAISEVFLHRVPGAAQLWVKIEFAPWFKALGTLPDQDHDGFPELYARVQGDLLTKPISERIEHEYCGRVLDGAAVRAWANQLASYWYPSFNTDLLPPGPSWPDVHTEPEITHELQGRSFAAPSVVLRGKPEGRATYEVLLIAGGDAKPGSEEKRAAGALTSAIALPKTQPSPDVAAITAALGAELARSGASSWQAWAQQLSRFHGALRKRNASLPRSVQALAGRDGFLFYRKGLNYVAGGELTAQAEGKNPLPIIVEYQRKLAALGVDFLFVPVPDKLELYPDALDPRFAALSGQVVNPWSRKLLLDLAEQGVESLDLLTPLLQARSQGERGAQLEPLFQHQDTHWTARGLELAAELIAKRITRFPWYPALSRHAQTLQVRDTSFTRFGDLHSRLPDARQKHYHPETLLAHQVLDAQGRLYEDDPDSPIVVLGDSFTGVYQLTDAEHAGLSAHIAKQLGTPVDLVMSYGGGPNVRNKLMRRGSAALSSKRLVVWVMAARDLYDYWEPWEPLKSE